MIQKKTTKDVYLAAAFLTSGAQLIDVNRDDPRHQEFEFSLERPDDGFLAQSITTNKDLDVIALQWANGTLNGNLYEFAKSIQRMKSVIHSSD
jgi:hypothetical protein